MIQIPEAVKLLFQQDSISKNFRVSFPNGEYPDLTNKDIVSESVIFTESVGSTTGLKFGLCEGATLEFDMFFNQNIRNMKIYAQIEIDISSLDAEFISEYGIESEDVPYPYYPIPYGYFYVDSCKRDGQNNQRRVVAYQNKWQIDSTSRMIDIGKVERLKMRTCTNSKTTYGFDLLKFICSSLNSVSILNMDAISVTENTTQVPSLSSVSKERTFRNWNPNPWNTQPILQTTQYLDLLSIDIFFTSSQYVPAVINNYVDTGSSSDPIYYMGSASSSFYNATDIFRIIFDDEFLDMDGDEDFAELLAKYPQELKPKVNMCMSYNTSASPPNNFAIFRQTHKPTSELLMYDDEFATMDSGDFVVYPYMDNIYSTNVCNTMVVTIPIGYEIWEKSGNTRVVTKQTRFRDISSYKVIDYQFDSMPMTFNRQPVKFYTYSSSFTQYNAAYLTTESAKFELSTYFADYVEMQAKYLRLDRLSESFEVIDLFGKKGLYPANDIYPSEDLYPSDAQHIISKALWRSVWYDDRASNPYDKVICTWKSPDGDDVYKERIIVDPNSEGYFADDYQQYDLSNNFYIKTQGILTEAQVDAVLDNFAEVLKYLSYYVADIEMRALPYMEAGDSVAVLTSDGGFDTFCLRHRISGIHALADSIEAR